MISNKTWKEKHTLNYLTDILIHNLTIARAFRGCRKHENSASLKHTCTCKHINICSAKSLLNQYQSTDLCPVLHKVTLLLIYSDSTNLIQVAYENEPE